jgi:hypothetical protein
MMAYSFRSLQAAVGWRTFRVFDDDCWVCGFGSKLDLRKSGRNERDAGSFD